MATTQPYRTRFKLQRLIDLIKKYYFIVVSFIKRILEFDPSTEHDYIYIQKNSQALLLLNVSELLTCNVLKHAPWEYDRCLFEMVLTEDILQRFEEHLHIYQTISPHDAVIVKLFLICLAFSSRIYPIYKKDKYHSKDFYPFPKRLLSVQNHYITLLWKYVIYHLGTYHAIIYIVRFIQHFLRRQILDADVLDIIYNRDDHGQLVALIRREISDN